jgi:hypothetical protein
VSDDPTIGACWDADRLNLWRLGRRPDDRLLSTDTARDPATIRWARELRDNASWDDWTHACKDTYGVSGN